MWEFTGFKYGNITLQTGMTATRGIVKSIKDLVLRVDYKDAFIIDKKTVEKTCIHIKTKIIAILSAMHHRFISMQKYQVSLKLIKSILKL